MKGIIMTSPNDDVLDELDLEDGMTIQEIYQQLLLSEDIILTTSIEDYSDIRRALASIKNKEATKLKEQGMPLEAIRLVFNELTALEDTPAGSMRFQISLARRKTFAVSKLEIPDGDI